MVDEPRFYLGVDGGGSGCRAALADGQGRVIGEGCGGPANIVSDPSGARASIAEAARAAMAGHCAPGQVAAVLGLAGANLPAAAATMAQGWGFARVGVVQDLAIAVAGALEGGDGIVSITGTGSAFARQRSGELRGIGGWGLVLGDEGSGAWIGRAICARALKAADGFVETTPFLGQLLAARGGPAGLVEFAAVARPAGFAELAPRVVAAAEAGDAAAAAVLDAAAADVRAAIDLLQQGSALPVVFLGGLGPVHAKRAVGRWPVIPPLGGPLDGALWLARQAEPVAKPAGGA